MNSITRQMLVAALLLAAVVGLFIAAQSGQRRLEDASRRVQLAAERETALGDLWQLLRGAESSERGYILVDNPEYLVPFQEAAGNLPHAVKRVDEAFLAAPPAIQADLDDIKRLSDVRFSEMSDTLKLYRTRGRAAAVEQIRTDAGQVTMVQIDDRVRRVQARETRRMLEVSESLRTSRWVILTTTTTALLASVVLVVLLIRLARRQLRSKELEAVELLQRRAELERVVARRTQELSELSTHLQSVAEQEKAALSRELHDELGGLLVAARMDVSWLEDRMSSSDPEVVEHFKRVQDALQSGVEMKRRVVENLRPSLLDNLGLFPALRWQVSDTCGRAGMECIEQYPAEELQLIPEASIAVFRIVQEALTNILKHSRAELVEITVERQAAWLMIRIRDDGVGIPAAQFQEQRSHGLASMRHRAEVLGGQWQVRSPADGGTEIEVRLPLERVLAKAPQPARGLEIA